MHAITITFAILFHLDHSLGLFSLGRSSIRRNYSALAELDFKLAGDTKAYDLVLPFLIPPFLKQRRLLVVARHVESSISALNVSSSKDGGWKISRAGNERVNHNC